MSIVTNYNVVHSNDILVPIPCMICGHYPSTIVSKKARCYGSRFWQHNYVAVMWICRPCLSHKLVQQCVGRYL